MCLLQSILSCSFLYTEPQSVLGFWWPLDACSLDNGCLWAVPGRWLTELSCHVLYAVACPVVCMCCQCVLLCPVPLCPVLPRDVFSWIDVPMHTLPRIHSHTYYNIPVSYAGIYDPTLLYTCPRLAQERCYSSLQAPSSARGGHRVHPARKRAPEPGGWCTGGVPSRLAGAHSPLGKQWDMVHRTLYMGHHTRIDYILGRHLFMWMAER